MMDTISKEIYQQSSIYTVEIGRKDGKHPNEMSFVCIARKKMHFEFIK